MTADQIGHNAEAEQHGRGTEEAIALTSKTQVRVGLAQLGTMLALGIGGATWATTISADIKSIREDIQHLSTDRWQGVDSNRYRLRLQGGIDLWEERAEVILSNAIGKPIDLPHLTLPDTNEAR